MTEYIVDQSKYTNMTMRFEIANGNKRIVRCRDCRHSTEEGITTECYFCHLQRWNTNPMDASPVEPNGFCAWGERRSDGSL